jgi:hypothetical protein
MASIERTAYPRFKPLLTANELHTRKVLSLEARHPPIYRRTRDVQDATDTELIPALIIELDDLDPGPTAVSLAVIVTQR